MATIFYRVGAGAEQSIFADYGQTVKIQGSVGRDVTFRVAIDQQTAVYVSPVNGGTSLVVPFSPLGLSPLLLLDVSNLSTLFQDAAATIPVVVDGDPVGHIADLSGNGYHLTASGADRPTYRTDGTRHWLEVSGSNMSVASRFGLGANPALTVVAAVTTNGSSTDYEAVWQMGDNTPIGTFMGSARASGNLIGFLHANGNLLFNHNDPGEDRVFGWRRPTGATYDEQAFFQDGVQKSPQSRTNDSNIPADTGEAFELFSNYNDAQPMSGRLYTLAVFGNELTNSQMLDMAVWSAERQGRTPTQPTPIYPEPRIPRAVDYAATTGVISDTFPAPWGMKAIDTSGDTIVALFSIATVSPVSEIRVRGDDGVEWETSTVYTAAGRNSVFWARRIAGDTWADNAFTVSGEVASGDALPDTSQIVVIQQYFVGDVDVYEYGSATGGASTQLTIPATSLPSPRDATLLALHGNEASSNRQTGVPAGYSYYSYAETGATASSQTQATLHLMDAADILDVPAVTWGEAVPYPATFGLAVSRKDVPVSLHQASATDTYTQFLARSQEQPTAQMFKGYGLSYSIVSADQAGVTINSVTGVLTIPLSDVVEDQDVVIAATDGVNTVQATRTYTVQEAGEGTFNVGNPDTYLSLSSASEIEVQYTADGVALVSSASPISVVGSFPAETTDAIGRSMNGTSLNIGRTPDQPWDQRDTDLAHADTFNAGLQVTYPQLLVPNDVLIKARHAPGVSASRQGFAQEYVGVLVVDSQPTSVNELFAPALIFYTGKTDFVCPDVDVFGIVAALPTYPNAGLSRPSDNFIASMIEFGRRLNFAIGKNSQTRADGYYEAQQPYRWNPLASSNYGRYIQELMSTYALCLLSDVVTTAQKEQIVRNILSFGIQMDPVQASGSYVFPDGGHHQFQFMASTLSRHWRGLSIADISTSTAGNISQAFLHDATTLTWFENHTNATFPSFSHRRAVHGISGNVITLERVGTDGNKLRFEGLLLTDGVNDARIVSHKNDIPLGEFDVTLDANPFSPGDTVWMKPDALPSIGDPDWCIVADREAGVRSLKPTRYCPSPETSYRDLNKWGPQFALLFALGAVPPNFSEAASYLEAVNGADAYPSWLPEQYRFASHHPLLDGQQWARDFWNAHWPTISV